MQAGDTISRYRILGPLGKGGMGIVYQAEDTRLHRRVALKFLPPDALTERDRQRFLNEARAAAQVRHPNICPIYDIEEADGQVFIAMAYLEGETLSRRLANGPLPIALAVNIALQIAGALQRAHELGIVHRDIKSSNIIIGPDGHVSILDFGLALYAGAARVTAIGSAVGTLAYMSPEQASGLPADHRSDIWAMGVVLFELLSGSLPFDGEGRAAMLHHILHSDPPDLGVLRPEIPPECKAAVEKALAKSPEARWQSARDMAQALTTGSASTATMVVPSQAAAPLKPRFGRRPVIAAAAAVIAGLVAAYPVWYWTRSRATPAASQVAILPFEVIGPSDVARPTSDGLIEILTAALYELDKSQGKLVAVPNTEIRRRNVASAEEARRVFGVNLAITGSVQPLGDILQFTLNLVDASKLRQIRATTFAFDPRNPVNSRDTAVERFAKLVDLEITPAGRRALTAGDASSPDAYVSYLHGRGLLARFDQAGNVDGAIDSFKQAIQQDPRYALAYAGLGEAYWRRGRAAGDSEMTRMAVENAERAVRLDGRIPVVHTVLGSIYGTIGRENDSIRELKRALDLDPGNSEALRELARVYNVLGRFQEAEASYLQAAKIRPTDWNARMLLGLFYYQQERYEDAVAEFTRAKSLTPDNDIVYRNLGATYLQQGLYSEAIEALRQSLRLKSAAPTYATLGAAYYYQQRFKKATDAAETAISLQSDRYNLWGNLGIYYKWVPGSGTKSEQALRRAVELGGKLLTVTPNDYNARANMAEYHARLGDKAAAMAEIDRIPKSAHGAAASRLALAYELTGRRADAIEMIRANVKNPASLNQVKDDPDLRGLWLDPRFQHSIAFLRGRR